MKDAIERAKVKAERKAARKAAKKANKKWLTQLHEAQLLHTTCPPPPITWGKHTSMRKIAKSAGRGPRASKGKTA